MGEKTKSAHFPKAVGAMLGFLVACATSLGEDFRVESAIYVEGDKEPCVESTTIFCGGIVYDYLKSPAEQTVFDKSNGRFVLLDLTRRVKAEVSVDKVTSLSQHLKTWATTQRDPLLRFLANPQFEEEFDPSSGKLTLSSPSVEYRLTTVSAESSDLSRQYREFSDWYCQLNTLLSPGSRPPFARLVVNEALEKHGRFPLQVELVLRPAGFPPRRLVIRSEHQLVGGLVDSDRRRVTQTDQYLAMFTPVALDEYQKKILE